MAKVVIDAGHGKFTAGKRCLKSLDKSQTREWVLNDRVADALEVYLKSAGHTVKRVDNTTGLTDVSLSNRVSKANKWKADCYISIHHNAGIHGGDGGGTVVFVCNNCGSVSKELQNAVYKHAINRGKLKGNRSDGTLASDFYVIKYTDMPAILIECGFMDSATDIEYILDPKWSKKIALGIAQGVCDVFGGEIQETSTKKKTTKEEEKKVLFKVQVICDDLSIRQGAGTKHAKVGSIKDKGVYSIVRTKKNGTTTWGELKSGKGWISLGKKYVKKLQ